MIVGKEPHADHYRFGGYATLAGSPIAIVLILYHLPELPSFLQLVVILIAALTATMVIHGLYSLLDKKAFISDIIIEIREDNNVITIKGVFSEFIYEPSMLVKMHPETLDKGKRAIVNMTIRLEGRRRFLTLMPQFENIEKVLSLLKNTAKY